MTFAARQADGALTFDVHVVPRSSRDRLGPVHGERLKVQLTAPPVDGAANAALIQLIADKLGCRPKDVSIVRGESGRNKTLRVHGATAATLLALLEKKDPT